MATGDPEQNHTPETLLAAGERLLAEGRKLFNSLAGAAHYTTAMRPDGTCPIFYQDDVYYICLPFGDFDRYQMHMVARRTPHDPQLLVQLFDLLPDLKGKAFLDVGSFTGSFAMVVRGMLTPAETHLFEPQKTMHDAIQITISANGAEKDTTFHPDIIDDGTETMLMGTYRPHLLSETPYLRRADSKLQSKSIDALKIEKVGLINLHFHNSKMYALAGAKKTIERDLPFITTDLHGRDLKEMRELLNPLGYEEVGASQHTMIFVPK
ncbi:MAG: hypothetical protein AAFQ64_04375 [Pseudomonadota bacterium]